MSATLDAALFRDYFGGPSACPCVEVQGRTHPVANYYLDDLFMATGYVVEENGRHALKAHVRSNGWHGSSSGGGSADVRVTGPGGRQRVEKIEWSAQDVHSSGHNSSGGSGGGGGGDPRASMTSRMEAVQRSMERVDESVLNLELIEEVSSQEQEIDHNFSHVFPHSKRAALYKTCEAFTNFMQQHSFTVLVLRILGLYQVLMLLCGPDRDRGGLLPPGAELYDPTQPNDDDDGGGGGRVSRRTSKGNGRDQEGYPGEDGHDDEDDERGEMAPRPRNGAPSMRGKTILVFLAGLGEIRQLMERLDASPLFGRQCQLQQQQQQQWVANSGGSGLGRFSNSKSGHSSSSSQGGGWCPSKFLVLPLHSSLSPNDQRRVFEPTPHDTTKIVISTNIAEVCICVFVRVCA